MASHPLSQEILDPHAAADYLCVTTRTLATWRAQGHGPRFAKIGYGSTGGRVRYRREDLDAWIASRLVG